MMKYNFLIVLACHACAVFSQYSPGSVMEKVRFTPKLPTILWKSTSLDKSNAVKPPLDTASILCWPTLGNTASISDDGRYFMYVIQNKSYRGKTLVVQAIDGSWKKEIPGIENGKFNGDSKLFIYLKDNVLHFISLGSDQETLLNNVSNFELFEKGDQDLLFYRFKSEAKKLLVKNLTNQVEQVFENVISYNYYEKSHVLLLEKEITQDQASSRTLEWLDLSNGTDVSVWSSKNEKLFNYNVDIERNQIALTISSEVNGQIEYSIWYYKLGMKMPVRVVTNSTQGISKGLCLFNGSNVAFTNDGRYLWFSLTESDASIKAKMAAQLDVWNYKDNLVQSMQLVKANQGEVTRYYAALAVKDVDENYEKIIMVTQNNEQLEIGPDKVNGDYFIARHDSSGDRFWERMFSFWLVSMKDGSRKLLFSAKDYIESFWFSPTGKYLLQYNYLDHRYYSYNVQTGEKYKISGDKNLLLNVSSPYYKNYEPLPKIAGWVGRDQVLIYDDFDIWQIDLSGARPPKCITSNYGKKHSIKIRLIEDGKKYLIGENVLLSLFDTKQKFNGLFLAKMDDEIDIDQTGLGPWTLYYDKNIDGITPLLNDVDFLLPSKAENSYRWLVKKELSNESPNYYVTTDFKSLKQLTNLQPQKKFNWFVSELLKFKQSDGSFGSGILYKPENFDSTKKYPVITWYYEQMTSRLHQFLTPGLPETMHIEIPWFVSHGYLVFTPDIYYTRDQLIESTCNSVVSAIQTLSLLPYVEARKIAISGFSWGGTQTNWLVTQSNIFAAAAMGGIGTGGVDPISTEFSVAESRGKKMATQGERVEEQFGFFWKNPKRWLSTSPILRSDKVSAPILMMQNYGDHNWLQSSEMFMALRRLNKPAWMLQYDRGSHGLNSYEDMKDFTVRMTQFFDHNLKDAPAPIWMTQGIPAKLKQIETGYAYDPSGNCGKDCKVCKYWNERYKKDSAGTMLEIREKTKSEHWMAEGN